MSDCGGWNSCYKVFIYFLKFIIIADCAEAKSFRAICTDIEFLHWCRIRGFQCQNLKERIALAQYGCQGELYCRYGRTVPQQKLLW